MKTLIKIFFAIVVSIAALQPLMAQTKAEKNAKQEAIIKELVNNKHFVFQATYALPTYGTQRYLNSYYDVRFTGDSLVSYLPYFGVAYSGVGYNSSTDNGIKFTSTKFDYKAQQKQNGSWYIIMKPKDVSNGVQMTFNIQTNGNADLNVISQNRQSIRFTGSIVPEDKKRK